MFIKKDSFVVFSHKKYDTLMVKQIDKIEKNSYFLLGIDKINSIDSREFGWIDKKNITHQVLFKIPKLFTFFKNKTLS